MTKPVTFGLINTLGQPPEWAVPWKQRYDALLEQFEPVLASKRNGAFLVSCIQHNVACDLDGVKEEEDGVGIAVRNDSCVSWGR